MLFEKINSYKNYKIYSLVASISIIILLFQEKKIFFAHLANFDQKRSITMNKIEMNNLLSQNAKLQYKLEKLSKYEAIYNSFEKTTNKIKSFLEVKYISFNLENKYIIASTNNNVKMDDTVLDENSFLIGRIIARNKNIVKILPIESKTSNIPVATSNGAIGILRGVGQKHCECEFIPLSNRIPDNDTLVVTSGIESLIPGGIIVGKTNIKGSQICVNLYRNSDFRSLVVLDSSFNDF